MAFLSRMIRWLHLTDLNTFRGVWNRGTWIFQHLTLVGAKPDEILQQHNSVLSCESLPAPKCCWWSAHPWCLRMYPTAMQRASLGCFIPWGWSRFCSVEQVGPFRLNPLRVQNDQNLSIPTRSLLNATGNSICAFMHHDLRNIRLRCSSVYWPVSVESTINNHQYGNWPRYPSVKVINFPPTTWYVKYKLLTVLPDFFIPSCSKYSSFTKWCFPVVLYTPRLSPKQLRAIFLCLWIIINYIQKGSGKMTFLRTLQSRYTSTKREKVFPGAVHFTFNSSPILSPR